jgi:hypothetical protein
MAKAVRIIINKDCFIQIDTGDDFAFELFLAQIRDKGYFLSDQTFIPLSKIEMIVYRDFEAPAVAPHIGGLN